MAAHETLDDLFADFSTVDRNAVNLKRHHSDDCDWAWRVAVEDGTPEGAAYCIKFATKADAEQAIRSIKASGLTLEEFDALPAEERFKIMVQDLKW